MSKLKVFLGGVEINEPLNYQDTEFEVNWDTDGSSQSISATDIELGLADSASEMDGYNIVKKHVARGISGGVGVTEGIPLKYVVDTEFGKTIDLFNGYLDTWRAQYRNGVVTAPIIPTYKPDWLSDVAGGLTFDVLFEKKLITYNDFVLIPYCIEKKQNTVELIVLLLSVFVIINTLTEQIEQLSEKVGEAGGVFTTIPAIIGLVARIIYIITLFIALIGLLINLFKSIIQPVKYHYGMNVLKQCQIAAKYLGLDFKCQMLESYPYNGLVILPEKYSVNDSNSFFKGLEGMVDPKPNDQKGYFKGTFSDLITEIKKMFNAKIYISNGILNIVPKYFNKGVSSFVLPDLYDSKYEYGYNHQDFVATEIFGFSTDQNDRHTIKEYSGTQIQITQTPKSVVNPQMRLTNGLQTNTLKFALGKKKTKLSAGEEILKGLFDSLDFVLNLIIEASNAIIDTVNEAIKLVNKLLKALKTIGLDLGFEIPTVSRLERPELADMINNRIGFLKMESDYVYVPKLLLLQGSGKNTKIFESNYLTANYLWNTYHIQTSFVGGNGEPPYQFLIKKANNVPMSIEDAESVIEKNRIFTAEGEAEVLSMRYSPIRKTCDIDYRIQKTYTNNIQIEIIEPNGR